MATKVWAFTRRHRELSSSTHRPRDGGPRNGSTDIEISRATCLRSIGYAKSHPRNELRLAGADAITGSNHALAEHVRRSPATG